MRFCLIILSLAALSAARGSAAAAPTIHEQVDAIFRPWDGKATPGCAAAILQDGVLEYERAYGMSDLERGVAMTPRSVLAVASISKQFTAFAIGLLVQEGRLALQDDIRKYLPEMPDYGRKITIDQLIHHTNGLRDQGHLLWFSGWRTGDVFTESDALSAIIRQHRLNFEPGSEVVYGNSAYTLLGVIVGRVSGRSLRDFAAERIFAPLGMADTRFSDDHTAVIPGRALGYDPRRGGGWTLNVPNYDHYGSTGLHTTAGDLIRWERNLLDGRIGGVALTTWLRTSGRLNDGTAIGYGGGLRLGDYRGLRVISHDGVDGGYRAEALLFPDQRFAIVALCNGAAIEPGNLVRRVADVYLGDRMRAPALAAAMAVPDREQAALAGAYWSAQTDQVVQLEWRGGALRQVGSATPLVPIGGLDFRPLGQPYLWRFTAPAAGARRGAQPELYIRDLWPTFRRFTRISAPAPRAVDLQTFAGSYRSEETGTTYTARISDGRLRLSWPRGYDLALEPVGGDRFLSPRATVTFRRGRLGAARELVISNRRLRRLVATRVGEKG